VNKLLKKTIINLDKKIKADNIMQPVAQLVDNARNRLRNQD
jgi:hypothetical protein